MGQMTDLLGLRLQEDQEYPQVPSILVILEGWLVVGCNAKWVASGQLGGCPASDESVLASYLSF